MAFSPLTAIVVVTSVVTLCQGQGQGQDATLAAGAYGSEVVDAVVERIRSRCVFSEDRLFLRRVAYVVSRDGEDSATYRANYDGGIWQVDEEAFNDTQQCSNFYIRSACGHISSSFGLNWTSVTWSDLRKPLYSGLAAALSTLLTLGGRAMPGSITEQAELYTEMYGGQNDTFINNADLATTVDCSDKLDLLFLLDSSGSVSPSDFNLTLKFAADVIDAMNISTDSVLVAAISFSSSVQRHFSFNDHTTKSQARNATLSIAKVSGTTDTAAGLDQAALTMYDTTAGARSDAKKVTVLVTDGQSDNTYATNQSAQALKDMGTTVFAVGVGGYNLKELTAVASDPKCSHVLTLTSFDHIQSILNGIQKSTCEANRKFGENTTITGNSTEPKETETTVPDKNKTIEASVTCGILNIYVSTSDSKPGPAVHDERYQATDGSPAQLTLTETLSSGTTLYITVVGTRLPASAAALRNCTDYSWTLGVVPKRNITVICQEDGFSRPCTSQDVARAKLCEKDDDRDKPVDNPCTPGNLQNGLLRHPYPYDPTKFLQCDNDTTGRFYVTLCPGGVTFNSQSRQCGFTSLPPPPPPPTSPPTGDNPCTATALDNNNLYHPHPADDTKFIQCDPSGKAWVKSCQPSLVWDQTAKTCVRDD